VVAWIVAVVGWGWYRWKEEVDAVRMVPVTTWQWQYWPSCGDKYKGGGGTGKK
jgi:hypothetical protein